MGSDKVEVKNHQIDGMNQVFKLLAVTEGQAGESAIEQAHGKVLAFNVAGADKVTVGITLADNLACAGANRGRIAAFGVGQVAGIAQPKLGRRKSLLHLFFERLNFLPRHRWFGYRSQKSYAGGDPSCC